MQHLYYGVMIVTALNIAYHLPRICILLQQLVDAL